ncbi:MAG: hypothetical protein CVU57_23430 [Deltaproteobacteria bacterium HGW-Deltaproteobacteria-15]|nr:MAG: hypothetical protein CVU57_23430 [Deltaproteobacteria bacterium HGW-Deltaproteobacteria-15]
MRLSDKPEIRKLAKQLGLTIGGDAVHSIRQFCAEKVKEIASQFGPVSDLNQFLELVASSLGIGFREVHSDEELQRVREHYLSKGELVFHDLHKELDAQTDAVLIWLTNAKPWEPKYVAIIDCRGHKAWRAYFSKWHEVAHVLSAPPQTVFKFHRTLTKKRDPVEQIVDRIAGDYAFYPTIFRPALRSLIRTSGRLTFEAIENLRTTVCPGASKEATVRGAISQCPNPELFLIADYALKKAEEKSLMAGPLLFEPATEIEPKLRAVEVTSNDAASKIGLWIHKNMKVPGRSIITSVFEALSQDEAASASEDLGWWRHSKGQLKDMPITVDAVKTGQRVYALITTAGKQLAGR